MVCLWLAETEKRFPVFKKKFVCADFFRCPQGFRLGGDRIWLPKLGWLRYFRSRTVEGVARNVTVSRRGAHWFVAVQTEAEIPAPVQVKREGFQSHLSRCQCENLGFAAGHAWAKESLQDGKGLEAFLPQPIGWGC